MFKPSLVLLPPLFAALACLHAQTTFVNVSVVGTLGPILQGTDPLGANGHNGILSMQISQSARPVTSTSNTVVYSLPAGTVTSIIGSTRYTTTTASRLTITLGSTADTLSVLYTGQKSDMTKFTASLAPGSFTTAVLAHPTVFHPSQQQLTSATSAGGSGSQLSYTSANVLTVLGLSGNISNSLK